ncbi:MAG: hypothetical protein R6V77_00590 [Candidatus Cloacimonadaceae bacterium]
MSLKKLALVALIVVMLVSTVIFFGCKPKEVVEETIDTTMVETVEEVVYDTLGNVITTTTTTETQTTP